jgi:hypothetical protein
MTFFKFYKKEKPNKGVLQKGKVEMRAEKDLHSNDVADLYLRSNSGQLKSVVYLQVIPSFTLILCSRSQLEILEKELENGPVRLFLDATGGITRKVNNSKLLHHVLLIALERDGKADLLLPIAEMISDDGTSANIGFFLRIVREKVRISAYFNVF